MIVGLVAVRVTQSVQKIMIRKKSDPATRKKASVTFSDSPDETLPKSASAKQLSDRDCSPLLPKPDNSGKPQVSGGPTRLTRNTMSHPAHLTLSPLCGSSIQNSVGTELTAAQPHIRRNESSTSVTIPVIAQEFQITRRPSILLQEILSTARRPSGIITALRPQGYPQQNTRARIMGSLHEDVSGSQRSLSIGGPSADLAIQSKLKNRRVGDDALTLALSALYCKLLVILGVALPVTEIISSKIPTDVYQGFYVYLYLGSISFIVFVYASHMKTRALFNILKNYHEKTNNIHIKRRAPHFGSFYLRVGAIAFGIGTMVYSGLEFGQYFELHGIPGCKNIFVALTPAARMALSIFQMQFVFLNTTELDMARHKVIARFGLMHMIATNLCEWLYVLVEETKHEIYHFAHKSELHDLSSTTIGNFFHDRPETPEVPGLHAENKTNILAEIVNGTMINGTHDVLSLTKRSDTGHYVNCQRTNIMGSLVQDASPFLFPCTIEYSLICAVILYEMWKTVRSIPDIQRNRHHLQKSYQKSAHHFSVDCSRAHRGMFAGIMIIVVTIICLIMYFVLHQEPGYEFLAVQEVTICEILMYSLTSIAVLAAMFKMRDLKFCKAKDKHAGSINLDCTLLVLAQTGVFVYSMFSIVGSYFSIAAGLKGSKEGLIAEVVGLFQTSIQTLFILNSAWRRCKGSKQQREKPGREMVTFLLVANVSMWFINTLIKGRAAFRSSHLDFYGIWAWTIITHVSMPLAIFYRFHSTICLFEIWKSAYKAKTNH